ncbi:MAG TPA: Ig-like domain-containing protein [Beijerinckiaceae bacterium]|nr:Ig-like domain-containing protein [Beijerinckiaceae bacterium]
MAALRGSVLVASAGALTVIAVGAITYRVWRDLPPQSASSVSTQRAIPSAPDAHAAPKAGATAPAKVLANETSPSASAAATKTQPAAATPAGAKSPSFDIVRVEPSGDTVVAGRAEPHAQVALLDKGAVVARAKADAAGEFAILPPPLAAGAHQLSLTMKANGQKKIQSTQSVTVAVPGQKGGGVVVALAAPGEPTKVLSDGAASVAPKAAPPAQASAIQQQGPTPAATSGATARKAQVYIRTVETGQTGGFFATGTATPGAKLRLYVNNSPVASVTVDPKGRWSLRVERGLTPGSYAVRADQIDPANGHVLSRAEVPFDFTGFKSAAAGAASAAPAKHVAQAAPISPPPALLAGSQRAAGPAARTSVLAQAPNAPAAKAAPAGRSALASEPAGPAPAQQTEPASQAPAAPQASVSAAASAQASSAANAFIEELPTVRVVRGDNLWLMSRKIFGRGIRYTLIYEANANQIRNRNLIYPGQIFVVPKG